MTDSIADIIIRLKNAAKTGKETVSFPNTKAIMAVLNVLERTGYLEVLAKKNKKIFKQQIEAKITYAGTEPKFKDAKIISKHSKRIYMGFKNIQPVKSGFGQLIISTPNGILTDAEARKQKVGGETLFQIW